MNELQIINNIEAHIYIHINELLIIKIKVNQILNFNYIQYGYF